MAKKGPFLSIHRRNKKTHKGDYGHVLVVAGSRGMTGAAFLCSESALLSGAGLVTLGVPDSLNPIMERKLTEVMTLPLPQTNQASLSAGAYEKIKVYSGKCDCLAIGCGLSQNKSTQSLVRRVIVDLAIPMVIDADAINALSAKRNFVKLLKKRKGPTILTPHPGEMARLINKQVSVIQKSRKTIAKSFADEYNVSIVLKGHRSVVASPGKRVHTNASGNPGMATGGTGDVLTGIIAAFIAQGMDVFKAACLGVYSHGIAGDMAAKEKGEISLRATDLLNYLPKAMKRCYLLKI